MHSKERGQALLPYPEMFLDARNSEVVLTGSFWPFKTRKL